MKNVPILLALLLASGLCAQEKGATPVVPSAPGPSPSATYAVVVGISDYQDPAIPDLRFADRDAEAFANWLRSPAGGSLPGDNIRLLLNENATLGKLVTALGWLIEVTKENDQTIVYFSGHGDVDAKLYGQPGFLLVWDTPAQMYMAGGYGLVYFQYVITTLSEIKKAKVTVITDACHAGKLAGSPDGIGSGAQLTNANLARQFSGEIKILSCQPDEYSIEGEQWGGGRGAFSYHLVDGLYGLADGNADAAVSLSELDRYLETNVTREVAPMQQTPMVVGDRKALLALVSPEALAQWRQGKQGQPEQFRSIENRGLEEETLALVDTSIRKLYLAFKQALNDKVFLEPADACADAYYRKLLAVEALEPLRGTMTRNYAAGLMDEGQQVTNKLLKTDPQVVSDALSRSFVFDHIHRYLTRAGELLGEGHFFYKPLMARQRYFEAKTYRAENYPDWPVDSLNATYLRKMNEGLTFDSTAAYIYLELAMYHSFTTYKLDKAEAYGKKSIELAPHCAVAYYITGFASAEDEAIRYFEKAVALDSTFFPTYVFLGLAYDHAGKHEKFLYFLGKYVRSIKELIRLDPDAVPVFYYSQLGNALWKLGRVREAEAVLLTAEKLSEGQSQNTYLNLGLVYLIEGNWEKAIQAVIRGNELSAGFTCETLGFLYSQAKQPSKAEKIYKNCIQEKVGDTLSICFYYRLLGDLYLAQGRRAEAESLFQKIIKYYPNPPNAMIMNFVGRAQYVLHGLEAMERTINRTIRAAPDNGEAYRQAACLYALAGKETEALEWLKRALVKDCSNVSYRTLADYDLRLLHHALAFQSLLKQYLPELDKD